MKYIMKNYKYLLMSLVAASTLVGCNDDEFLKEDPKTIYTVDNAFEKSSQVDATISRAYYTFSKLHGWDNFFLDIFDPTYGYRRCNVLGGQGADTMGGDGRLDHVLGGLSDFQALNPDYADFNDLWNDLYELAAQANMARYGATQVNWSSETEKNTILAQANFFLGWAYLRLGECYGGVPIVPEYSEELKFDYTRSTREETYRFAIENLETALNGLPEYPQQDGRVAKGAVNHYLAEAYIALGTEIGDKSYFQKAIDAAKQTIQMHPLMTERFGVRANPADNKPENGSGFNPFDYSQKVANYKPDGDVFYDLFQIGNYNRSQGNTEALLVAQTPTYDNYSVNGGLVYPLGITCYAGFGSQYWSEAYRSKNPNSQGPWFDSEQHGGNKCAYLGGNTWGIVGSTDYSDEVVWEGKFADDIRNSELNRTHLVVTDPNSPMKGQIVTPDMLQDPAACMRTCAKISMADGWGWDSHHSSFGGPYVNQYGRGWYMARTGETYLLLAEAYLRNGDMNNAVETINVLRKRAKASYLYSTLTLRDILDERARELAWEEHRWPTLLRWDSSKGTNEDMKYQLANYTMLVNDLGVKSAGTPAWTLFPIPTTVINLNTGATIEQNPGWK